MTAVLTYPNAALKQNAQEVDPANDRQLKDLVKRMAQAMYESHGIGLAAPQIGVMKRVIVYDLDDGLVALCNPRITARSEDCEYDDEGCLSLPGISVPVSRSCSVTCEAETLDGETISIEADGLLARMFQHEIDHLDGTLIIDRATPQDRKEALRRYLDTQQGDPHEPDGGL